ncbi:MAG: hypothetical protein RR818_01225 [Citrobacter sp.]
MFYLDNVTGVPEMPPLAPVANRTLLFFTEGGNRIPASYPGADWFNIVQSELLNVIKEAGMLPVKAELNQLVMAIKRINGTALSEDALLQVRNGADIPDKALFIDNLGLRETVNKANNAVPKTRKINKKSLDDDITLTAEDVGALPETYKPPVQDLSGYMTIASANAIFVRGFRMANYGVNGSEGVRDGAQRMLTGIYATNGWNNPSTHESRQLQFDVNGTYYNVAWV